MTGRNIGIAVLALAMAGVAAAATVPFTENFALDSAGWSDAAGATPLSWLPNGGPNGTSYASGSFSFAAQAPGDTPVILRAQASAGASDNAFVGNYLADGVSALRMQVRHSAPQPLNYFVRLSKPANFPAAVAVAFQPVLPNTWTEIQFDLSPSSPQFISFETSDYVTIFSGIGNLQVGVLTPAGLPPTPFDFDIDQVELLGGAAPQSVPALSTVGMIVLVGALMIGLGIVGRRRLLRS